MLQYRNTNSINITINSKQLINLGFKSKSTPESEENDDCLNDDFEQWLVNQFN